MNTKCKIEIDLESAKSLKKLAKYCGTDTTMFENYLLEVLKDKDESGNYIFEDDFIKYWNENNNGVKLDINTTSQEKLKNTIISYYNEKRPNAYLFVNIEKGKVNPVKMYHYTNNDARSKAIKDLGTFVILGVNDPKLKNIELTPQDKGYLYLRRELMNRLAQAVNMKYDSVLDEIIDYEDFEEDSNIEHFITVHKIEEQGYQFDNLLALYNELTLDEEQVHNELLKDKRLLTINLFKKEQNDEETIEDEDDSANLVEDTTADTYLKQLSNKYGETSNFVDNLSDDVKQTLASLFKCKSINKVNNKPDYDTDTYTGIPDTMDVCKVSAILYQNCPNIIDDKDMIKKFKKVAKQIPGMEAIDGLCDKLNENIALRSQFYKTFKKTKVEKTGIEIINEVGNIISFNNNIDAKASLIQNFTDKLKYVAISNDITTLNMIEEGYKTLSSYITTLKRNELLDTKLDYIISNLSSLYNKIYPLLNEETIKRFINFNESETQVNVSNNIDALINVLGETTTNLKNINKSYENYKYKIQEQRQKDPNDVETLNELKNQQYVVSTDLSSVYRLVDKLYGYINNYVPINSANSENKQVSAIINNSMMTEFINNIKSDLNVINSDGTFDENSPILTLKDRFKNEEQYRHSNILLEHKTTNGKIINKGLFKINEKGEYVPTPYATDLINIVLFDGVKNSDNNEAVRYSKMFREDFFGSSYRYFFKQKTYDNKELKARYFMRIPSDKPKIFMIDAPRYSVQNLLQVSNYEEKETEINNFINNLPNITENNDIKFYTQPIAVYNENILYDSVLSHLNENTGIKLPFKSTKLFHDNAINKTIKIALNYSYKGKNNEIIENKFVIEGIYKGKGIVSNVKFIGKLNSFDIDINENIKNRYLNHIENLTFAEGGFNYNVSTNHPIFYQLENMFYSELNDMGIILNDIFELVESPVDENSKIIALDEKGLPKIKKDNKYGMTSHKDVDRLIKIYHCNKDSIFKLDSKGNISLNDKGIPMLSGRAFESLSFQFFDRISNKNVNYGEELLNNYFEFFENSETDYNKLLSFDKNGNISFSDVQQKAIDDTISKFIIDYTYSTKEESKAFDFTINETYLPTDIEHIAEYVLNYRLMSKNFDDLFEGNSKFYKDTQTFLKRAAETQGSGVKFCVSKPKEDGNHIEVESELDSAEIYIDKRQLDGSIKKEKIKQYNTFKAITIENSTITHTNDLNYISSIITDKNIMGDNVLSEERAKQLMQGFEGVTVNDAQSYITLEEFIRRITAKGYLPKYRLLIDKLLDENSEITKEDIKEFVQVQKNFYYDLKYDDNVGMTIPKQIKNAEFVLIPKFIKNTELEKLYNFMQIMGVDQVNTKETSKASNAKTFVIWDNNGEFDKNLEKDIEKLINPKNEGKNIQYKSTILNEFVNNKKDYIEYYDYNKLYEQLDAKQHVADENKVGIQFIKKIGDNLIPDSEAQKTYDRAVSLYVSLINSSFNELIGEMTGKDGELDPNLIYKKFINEAARTGLTQNIIDCFTPSDPSNSYRTLIPSYLTTDITKLENIVQSVFNNTITRQKFPGFHCEQVASLGFKQYENKRTSSSLKWHGKSYKLKDEIKQKYKNQYNLAKRNEELYHEINEDQYNNLSKEDKKKYYYDGMSECIEVLLPYSAFGFDRNGERYKDLDDDTAKRLMLIDLQTNGLDKIIGYRIPTESKASMATMRVVGFLDEAQGSTIVVPDLWVAQTGSDFDADSIYGMQYPISVNKFGVPFKSTKNNKKVVQNEMLDCFKSILADPQSYEEHLSRSNNDDITEALKDINAKNKNDIETVSRKYRSTYHIFDQARYQTEAMSGQTLKGFSVSRDGFCSHCNKIKPYVDDKYQIKVKYKTPVEELRKHFDYVDENGIVTHNTFGWSKDYKNAANKLMTMYSAETTAYILDAMKNGSLPNVTETTFGAFKCLIDMGCTYDIALAFMMQPAINEFIKVYNSSNSIYNDDYKATISSVYKSLLNKAGIYVDKYAKHDDVRVLINNNYKLNFEYIFDYDKLIDRIENYNNDVIADDFEVLMEFEKLLDFAKSVRSIQMCTTSDKFGAKPTFFQVRKILDTIINNKDNYALYVNNEKEINDKEKLSYREPLINSIYPGVVDCDTYGDLEKISENEDFINRSTLPAIAAFLRNATIQSYKINRKVFELEGTYLNDYVERIVSVFSRNTSLNEAQFNEVRSYFINYFRTNTSFVIAPLYWTKDGFVYDNIFRNKDGNLVDENIIEDIKFKEFKRIYGIARHNKTDFQVKSLFNPTEEEINKFYELSPAEKLYFVQSHFENIELFKDFDVIFNANRSNNFMIKGMHYIKYKESATDIDNVRKEFRDMFSSKNPFLACTAADLLKYAIVVEGFKLGIHNVSKSIDTSVLYNQGNFGVNIVSEIRDNIETQCSTDINEELCDKIYESYVRSKSNNIITKYVQQVQNENHKFVYELPKSARDVIRISNDNTDKTKELLKKYAISDNNDFLNKYVKLKFDSDVILYKIVPHEDFIWLYPLNDLHFGEFTKESFDTDLHKYPSAQQFEEGIAVYEERLAKEPNITWSDIVKEKNIKVEPKQQYYDERNIQNLFNSKSAALFNEEVIKALDTTPVHYKLFAPANKVILDNTWHIVSLSSENKTEEVAIRKVNPTEYKEYLKKYTGNNFNKPIEEKDKQDETLINIIRNRASYNKDKVIIDGINDLYLITTDVAPIKNLKKLLEENKDENEIDEGTIKKSTSYDVASQAIESGYKRAINNSDKFAKDFVKSIQAENITSNKESLKNNFKYVDSTIRLTANYLEKLYEDIEGNIHKFVKDEEGNWLSINDDKCIAAVEKDKNLRNEYMKLLMTPKVLIDEYSAISELEMTSEDNDISDNLQRITNVINKLKGLNVINESINKFAKIYYKDVSTNPLVNQGLMEITDGYYKTTWLEAMFMDIQESSNSLIQIAMKNFKSDLYAKELQAKKDVESFLNAFKIIEETAKKHGKSINWNNIIDGYGRIIRDYNENFVKDRKELHQKELQEKIKDEYSVDHLRARLKYDEFLTEHTERPVVKEYYIAKNKLLNKLLNATPESYATITFTGDENGPVYTYDDPRKYSYVKLIPQLYSDYKKAILEFAKLNQKYVNDVNNPEYISQLNKLYEEFDRIKGWWNYEMDSDEYLARKELTDLLRKLKENEDKYFAYTPKKDFNDNLKENLEIIEKFEFSGTPYSIYKNNPIYQKAKHWILQNTIEDVEKNDEWEEIHKILKEADKKLSHDVVKEGTEEYNILNNPKYKDIHGKFDPTLVSVEDAKKLKELQQKRFNFGDGIAFNDRTLIKNTIKDENGNVLPIIPNNKYFLNFVNDPQKNVKYYEIVTEINNILSIAYNNETLEIDLEKFNINDDEYVKYLGKEYVDNLKKDNKDNTSLKVLVIDKLNKLYKELDTFKTENTDEAKEFIKNNTVRLTNDAKYAKDLQYIESLPKGIYKTLLYNLTQEYNEYKGELVPSSKLYSEFIPAEAKNVTLESLKDKKTKFTYIDKEKTLAAYNKNKYTERKVKNIYYEVNREMSKKSKEEYQEWYNANHIYNPYSRAYEPINIWFETKYKFENKVYNPAYNELDKVIRDGNIRDKENTNEFDDDDIIAYDSKLDYRNKNYKENVGILANYKKGSKYDAVINANEYELQLKSSIEKTLSNIAKNELSKSYIEKGYMPARRKHDIDNTKGFIKETLKAIGFMPQSYNPDDWKDDVSFANDEEMKMPLLKYVKDTSKNAPKMPKYPKLQEGESRQDYAKRVLEYEQEKEEVLKYQMEYHKQNLDSNWLSVITDFIMQGSRYNAIQSNKYELFFTLELLKRYGSYNARYTRSGKKNYISNYSDKTEESKSYATTVDENAYNQFTNQIRREVYNQFKKPNNPKLIQAMQVLQTFTSSNLMMFNFKGGIANVTYGSHQILGEAHSNEAFDKVSLLKGMKEYNLGITDYLLHSGSEKYGTIQNGLIKLFDIVDLDEINGRIDDVKLGEKAIKKIIDYGYAPQSSGEHVMQNTVLFAMLESHRLFVNPNADKLGEPKYYFKNFNDYVRDNHEKALLSILNDEQKEEYEKFKKEVSNDANTFKDYAHFRKNVVTEFIKSKNVTKEQRLQFVTKRKEIDANSKKEFNDDVNHPTLRSQFDFVNGKVVCKNGSKLAELDSKLNSEGVSQAFKLLANFKNKVISVNKYIHGSYDKSGRAQIESSLLGSLIMQFHKHLPMSIRKRYNFTGSYNESRETVNKGRYASLIDFIKLSVDKVNCSEEERTALKAVQNTFRNIIDFALNIKLNYQLLEDYDKANIRRSLGDISGILAALFAVVALKCVGDDDDDDSILYNLALYEADRLGSESGQYFPLIAYSEAKKIWQSPIAAGSGITDVLSSMNMLAHMIIDGEDFDGEYHSGKFAGENKLTVYVKRRIPIWRGIQSSFIDITKSNKYYKIGDNFLTFVPVDDIVESIKE